MPAILRLPPLPASTEALRGCREALQAAARDGSVSADLLGGSGAWNAWLQSLSGLSVNHAAACGPDLWDMLAALAVGVSTPMLWEFAVPFSHLLSTSTSALGQNQQLARAMLATSASVAEGLWPVSDANGAVAPLSPAMQQALVVAFASCTSLLSETPALLPSDGGRAAEAWLRAALHVGLCSEEEAQGSASEQLHAACIRVLEIARVKSSAPLLNFGWKLLKQICLHAQCHPQLASRILCLSADACGRSFQDFEMQFFSAAANKGRAVGDALHLATFHGSNFTRLLRNAQALTTEVSPEWLAGILSALGPEGPSILRQVCSTPTAPTDIAMLGKAKELLEKIVKVWLDELVKVPGCRTPFAAATVQFLSAHWCTLAADGSVGDPVRFLVNLAVEAHHLDKRSQASASVALKQCQAFAHVDALAALCAAGAPGLRQGLLTWAVSDFPSLHVLALRVHAQLPYWQGSQALLTWAQILLDLLICSGKTGREEHQLASCLAALLAHSPKRECAAWVESTILPRLLQSPSPGLYLLLQKLGKSSSASEFVVCIAEQLSRAVMSNGASMPSVASEASFRALAALISSTPDAEGNILKDLQGRAQAVLDRSECSLEARLAAWELHMEICFRLVNSNAYGASIRYAMKHLSSSRCAGVRVAQVVARSPANLLKGPVEATLQGLCEMHWPLRVAGLTAAEAVSALAAESASGKHPQASAGVSPQVRTVADAATRTFHRSFGPGAANSRGDSEASNSSGSQTGRSTLGNACESSPSTKRRRLLQEILRLPSDIAMDTSNNTQEMHDLCVAAEKQIHTWMQASRPPQGDSLWWSSSNMHVGRGT